MRIVLLFICAVLSNPLFSQGKTDTASLKEQLSGIYDRDQKTRTKNDSVQFMQWIDSLNLIQVEAIIARYGWPGKDFVGNRGNTAVFLVIQHSNLATQEKYLPLLKKSVADSQSRPCDLALMEDRVLMWQGEKQLYGSQIIRNKTTGAWEFYPIEDEKNVNARRREMGLEPIEEYARYFGIDYKAPTD